MAPWLSGQRRLCTSRSAQQPQINPNVIERVRQRVSDVVDMAMGGRPLRSRRRQFTTAAPRTEGGHGFTGQINRQSGLGPFSGGQGASDYLSRQNWKGPSFDPNRPASGGSRYSYFTDPDSGTGGYVTDRGTVHTYSI